jgi:hypothetical protein
VTGPNRAAEILATLNDHDVMGGFYPTNATTAEERRRWNQSRLVALALHHQFEPSMQPGEYSQSVFMMAGSIYSEDRAEFPTGTDEELAEEIELAVEVGWL